MNSFLFNDIVQAALQEDIGFHDLTTEATVDPHHTSSAELLAKEHGVLAGLEVAFTAFRRLDPSVQCEATLQDGDSLAPGQVIAKISGHTASLLSAERVALNFLQHLCGVATATRKSVEQIKAYNCRIVDTRKTTPGLRLLEKYAVRVGGGYNHRLGLFDAVLIKDNHIAAAGGITAAVQLVRKRSGHTVKIEVETETLAQVKEAFQTGADIIMLDNMSPALMREAVQLTHGKVLTEASGGLTLDALSEVAATGVDLISLGWLTHSVKALDISLNIKESSKYI
ncbi:MAG: carboxylating nicotinate-nucleotide diphosphorylase [Peptococcaceae bacterium]|nr:carboxylating nicotinate-nucleotide diphosphorylase [Peptococcaceae bacterium]